MSFSGSAGSCTCAAVFEVFSVFSKAMPFAVGVVIILMLLFCFRSAIFKAKYEEALKRAEHAEEKATALELEKQKLGDALAEQEKATAEAQNNRRVVYRTVQKEVSSNADSRDWYNTAVPAGFVRVLKDGSKAGGNTRAAR